MTAPFHFDFDRAVAASDLPMPVRHLLMCINIRTDRKGNIPPRFQPSYADLGNMMGAAQRSVIRWVTAAENAGWLVVVRPSKHDAQVNKARNTYRLVIPDAPNPGDRSDSTGHVTESQMPGDRESDGHVTDGHTSQNLSDHSHWTAQSPPHSDGVSDAAEAIEAAIDRAGDLWGAADAALDMSERGEHPRRIVNTLDARTRELSDEWERLWGDQP